MCMRDFNKHEIVHVYVHACRHACVGRTYSNDNSPCARFCSRGERHELALLILIASEVYKLFTLVMSFSRRHDWTMLSILTGMINTLDVPFCLLLLSLALPTKTG